ncbi:MAG: site-2 protease family protein [Mycobacterium sp.]|nr:site-2 protease family protein [Mycobacterium sp.]
MIGAVLLLASLLAHELTHAVVARRAGITVSGVTLWMLGGIASLGSDAKTPKTEFRVAVSGPLTSLALAALFAGAAAGLHALGVTPIVVGVASWLSGINLLLGLFNLLPGTPLDGGRILRAYLWRRHGDPVRAAVGAARGGRILGFILIGLGLLQFVAGSLVGGVWMAFIGWFLLTAARTEENQVLARQSLAGVRVADAMTAHPRTAAGWITVEDFIHRYLLGDRHSAYPVEGPDGSITGLITLTQLRAVAPDARATTLVRDAAIPLHQVPTAEPHEPLTALVERLTPNTGARVLVVDAGHVVGIITATDIARLIDVRGLDLPRPAAGHPTDPNADPDHHDQAPNQRNPPAAKRTSACYPRCPVSMPYALGWRASVSATQAIATESRPFCSLTFRWCPRSRIHAA